MQSISTHSKRPRNDRPLHTPSIAQPHKSPHWTIQLANKSKLDYAPKLRTIQKE